MKTIKILLAVAFMSVTSTANAQGTEIDNRENLRLGIKAGLNYSNVYNSSTEEFRADGKAGFAGGLFLAVPVGKFLGFQPELLLSQKGFKGEGVFLGSNYSFSRTTTYLDIPLQISLKPSEFITIVAGPQYSYLLSQRDDFRNGFINSSHEEEFDNENIRNNIFGFVVGIDLHLKHVVLGTRVGWDIMDNHGDGTSSTPRYKNAWLQATLGYMF